MSNLTISIQERIFKTITRYLRSSRDDDERAAFGFVRSDILVAENYYSLVDWMKMDGDMLDNTSPYHITLTDLARQTVIKTAHDYNAALIEFHSHTGAHPAQFSYSDLAGFSEWVPHVMWRLPNRPYIAVVITNQDYDSLFWAKRNSTPCDQIEIDLGTTIIKPTQLTLAE